MSSGTSEREKFPHNRRAFIEVVSGQMAFTGERYNPHTDISFWDANFDCTDRINRMLGMESSLAILLQCSVEQPIQFVIPAARVRKMRIANRPFANNQVHKGGIEQIAESMIATCPFGIEIRALDTDGLFVFSAGEIFYHLPNQAPQRLAALLDMEPYWKQYEAFSREVWLDHKPIAVQIGQERYSFHNFMDFKGDKGIAKDFWYDETSLLKEEQTFVEWLRDQGWSSQS